MKKFLFLFMCAFTTDALALSEPPFEGKRLFGFGGVPAWDEFYVANISQDGYMILKKSLCTSLGCKTSVIYRGKFKDVVPVPKEEWDIEQQYIQFGYRQARLLDQDMKLAFGCDGFNNPDEEDAMLEPCISSYNEYD